MTLEEIIRKVAEEKGLPYDVCHKAYMSAWRFIYDHIQEQPLSHTLPIEEFRKLRLNFNMPSLGKFHVTEESFTRKINRFLIIQKLHELKVQRNAENKED